ncbi:SDR family oxidoreductase [Novosphingobium sp. KCTC 2891]|uniref:SDR family oxidoreductase n=1 Tax=Novosphingobium sp. KCTC 2891 TaxID=2989730 RepID=UPI0022227DA5|nr:SDR family oxidoreductase [Novosphingobium sp. KCTC 2891]MCW1383780.1 SDR family oxidoreductase [Novosphingobium sp. KCTC 2891]
MSTILEDLFSLSGKTAVVTGGARGVGAMISRGLVRAGAEVLVVARPGPTGEAFAAEMANEGKCHFIAADLADAAGVEQAAAAIARIAPKLHVLVNNAGVFSASSIEDATVADWDRGLAVNLRAPFFLVQSLLPQLRAAAAQGDPARVINIGSIAALWAKSSNAYAYGAAKAGLQHLTRMLASDLTREGIAVNAIAPGFFPSDMTDGFFTAAPGLREQVIESIPAHRLGAPEDVAGSVIFLASRAGAYCSGATIPLEGGLWSA